MLHSVWTDTLSSIDCTWHVITVKASLFTLESNGKLQNLGRRKAEVPKLEGMTIGFALVPGRASYASISKMDEERGTFCMELYLLDHFYIEICWRDFAHRLRRY